MKPCNQNLVRAIELANNLLDLARAGEMTAEDDSCVVLYGLLRDCAYKIRERTQAEVDRHRLRGVWDPPVVAANEMHRQTG